MSEDVELITARALTHWQRLPRPVLLLLTAVAVRGGPDGITPADALWHARWTFGGYRMADATLCRAWDALTELQDGNGQPIVTALPSGRYALAALLDVAE
jgi:hypothetical protein